MSYTYYYSEKKAFDASISLTGDIWMLYHHLTSGWEAVSNTQLLCNSIFPDIPDDTWSGPYSGATLQNAINDLSRFITDNKHRLERKFSFEFEPLQLEPGYVDWGASMSGITLIEDDDYMYSISSGIGALHSTKRKKNNPHESVREDIVAPMILNSTFGEIKVVCENVNIDDFLIDLHRVLEHVASHAEVFIHPKIIT
jgi:hypothetical protein